MSLESEHDRPKRTLRSILNMTHPIDSDSISGGPNKTQSPDKRVTNGLLLRDDGTCGNTPEEVFDYNDSTASDSTIQQCTKEYTDASPTKPRNGYPKAG